jgi:hypothetical protein
MNEPCHLLNHILSSLKKYDTFYPNKHFEGEFEKCGSLGGSVIWRWGEEYMGLFGICKIKKLYRK